ncbi:hypothetical protein OF83DRAFT_1031514, partial [Amylostereum chailletii]
IIRIPLLRTLSPRIAQVPVLPISSRLGSSATKQLTRTPRISSTRLFSSTRPRLSSPPPHDPIPPNTTLTQRLKILVKSYGWYALGVYVVVSILDFSVAFAGINLLGAEYVSALAASAKSWVLSVVSTRPIEPGHAPEPEKIQSGHEGIYAMLVLAYTVHKTLFLPVRIGVTAAFTPRLVGWLRSRGWAGGEGARRAMHDMRDRIRER